MSHTKLPWFGRAENGIFIQGTGWKADCDKFAVVSSAAIHHNGKVVCLAVAGSNAYNNDHKEELIANAELIVKCVNAHEDLMKIAETLRKFDDTEGLSPPALGLLRDWAVAALDKIEKVKS